MLRTRGTLPITSLVHGWQVRGDVLKCNSLSETFSDVSQVTNGSTVLSGVPSGNQFQQKALSRATGEERLCPTPEVVAFGCPEGAGTDSSEPPPPQPHSDADCWLRRAPGFPASLSCCWARALSPIRTVRRRTQDCTPAY